MPGKALQSILKKVAADITETRELLDSCTTLFQHLELLDGKSSENDEDLIEKTKDLVDRLEGKVTSVRTYFYKNYNIRKKQKGPPVESESESPESAASTIPNPCIIDDSFNADSTLAGSVNADTSNVSSENPNSDTLAAQENIENEDTCSNSISINNIESDKEITEGKEDTGQKSKSKLNEKSSNDSDKPGSGSDGICSANGEIQNVTNKSKNATSADSISETNSLNTSEETEIVDSVPITVDHVESENAVDGTKNSNKDNDNDDNIDPLNIDHISVSDANNLNNDNSIDSLSVDNNSTNDPKNLDRNNDNGNNIDPLFVDNNSISNDIEDCSNSTSSTNKSNDINKPESVIVKAEPSVKIKCVDIKKLLDPEATSHVGSVIVLSDSDNECSSKKKNKERRKDKSDIDLMNLPPDITLIPKKKVIVLDDSDSDDAMVRNQMKTSKETRRVSFNLSNSQSEETSSKLSVRRRNPKRKVVQDLANVSSLSEVSTGSSNDSDTDRFKNKKKSKGILKAPSIDDSILLKAQKDEKFSCKAYVPLTRIPAKQLKANYEKKMLKMDIRRLTNLKNLKRSRRRNSESSDSAELTNKEKKRNRSKNKTGDKDETDASDGDVSMKDPLELNGDNDLNNTNTDDLTKDKSQIENALLDGINSDNSDRGMDTHSDVEGKDAEKDKETTKKKQKSDKKSEEKEKKSEEKEDDKSSKEGSDTEAKKNKEKKWRKDKLLTENITESDSDEDFAKFMKKKDKEDAKKSDSETDTPKKQHKRLKKQKRKNVLGSDSEASANSRPDSSSSKSSESSSDESSKKEEKKKPSRRRIKKIKDSSDSDEDKSTRKNIRKVWKNDSLSETTIAAEKAEKERKMRIAERQKKYNQIFEADLLEKATVDKVILDFNEETEEELLKVDPEIVKHLKPHQAKGIQFMWNTCFESIKRTKETKGSGCILAHCMGLGKTLQVIALTHTLLTNEESTGIRKVLVVCPMGTVLNWAAEFKKWLPEDSVEVFELVSFKQNTERMYQVKEWDRIGGALILGYDMFRNLTNTTNKRLTKKMRTIFQTCLVDPGPQLVVCDEGHLLKNEKTSISIAMNRVQSMRRIVLTGTPLQNNMKEYFCMVQFVKPNLLGTYREYLNRFVNPITNGQYTDSTPHDIQIMRKRSHVLHKLLDGIVQRKDYSVLAPFLPPKYEYVLFVALTEIQIKLYEHYMRERSQRNTGTGGRSSLFVDFNEFQRICTHPRVLLNKSIEMKQARDKQDLLDDESEGSLRDFINDDDTERSSSSSSSTSGDDSGSEGSHKKDKKKLPNTRATRATRATEVISDSESEKQPEQPDPSEWWREYCNDDDLDNLLHSGKLALLFEILRHCEVIGDKVLIFSQSLYSLNLIEYFLNKIDEATQNSETNSFCGFSGSWSLGLDYFRLDGSSSCDSRAASCKKFNNTDNTRARLFLISTRAGGLGINLVAANRVIIFDVSWNPSHDTQSIYRVYRFGQTKPSYIYRFVTLGTMEMKIYERQVIKQAISKRVIDEQQIDRHYNQSDLAELYKFEPVPEEERPIPLVPKDVLLGELLQMDKKIYKYHEHQSLLENKVDEVLDEEERKAAWEEFENEKLTRTYTGTINNYPVQMLQVGIQSIIRKENPTWTGDLVAREAALMFKRLQEEVQMGISPIFQRTVAEIRSLQQAQENYYKMVQQQHAMMQYQKQLAQQFNYANRMPGTTYGRQRMPTNGMPNPAAFRQAAAPSQNPTEYIDLND